MYCIFQTAHLKFRFDAELNGNTITVPTLKEMERYFAEDKPMKINLGWMLKIDRMQFEEMNKAEDSRHQVNLDDLTIRGIRLFDGIEPQVSIDYLFNIDEDGWGRGAYGELTDLGEMLESDWNDGELTAKKGEYLPMNFYTKGAHVTW